MARQTLLSEKPKKKRGPAPTGVGTLIGVRLLPPNLSALDTWISRQPDPKPTRPEAIRRLVETGLASEAAVALPHLSDAALDHHIAEQEAVIANIPEHSEPSPEAALAAMDKALAKNDLIKMKNKRVRLKNATRQ